MLNKVPYNKSAFLTGHRPKDLPGKCYSPKDEYWSSLLSAATLTQEYLIVKKDVQAIYYGGAQGWDTVGFYAGFKLKEKYPDLKLILAIPFEEQCLSWVPKEVSGKWSIRNKSQVTIPCWQWCKEWAESNPRSFGADSVLLYTTMIENAYEVIYTDTLENYAIRGLVEGTYHAAKMQQRNIFMADVAMYGLGCFNGNYIENIGISGKPGGTMNCLEYADSIGSPMLLYNPFHQKIFKVRV